MPKLNVPPTKSNLLNLKQDLGFAREGFDMLERKRQILVLELIGMVEAAKRVQQDVAEKMKEAFAALREAQIRRGAWPMAGDTLTPATEHSAVVDSRSLMGIYLPTLAATHPPLRPRTGLMSGTAALDAVEHAFNDALEAIDRLAEVETSVFRLAREVRKTLRRVNALEKIFIPDYEDTLHYITGVLEERERDDFVIMRMVRERLDRQRQGSDRRRSEEEGDVVTL
jgi:V/A-type H+-transporting ATPase subunit D